MKILTRVAFILCLAAGAHAAVVRPAPNFGIDGAAKATSLRSFHGQPVVIVFGRTARDRTFRKQLLRLQKEYSQFASEKVVFIAVIQNGPALAPSNIPFALAANPATVASDYDLTGPFGIAVIGKDGNVDLITPNLIPASRVRDAIFNSYENQVTARATIH